MKVERSQKLLITSEARALKQLRKANGLTMTQAATGIGKSKPYIAHIESGRMNIPPRDKLIRLLAVYGITTYQSFYNRVRNFKERTTLKR